VHLSHQVPGAKKVHHNRTTTINALPYSKFSISFSIGYMLVIMYCCFLAYSILCEMELVHAYGTNHVDDEIEDYD
jgi:hypothetical protein